MRERQTLFTYVYRDLEEQILSGRLKYGDKLPSLSGLSERYHVGVRTVKDVLCALREKGYIRTEERKAAVVVHRQTELNAAASSVLERRTAILEVYRTVELLEPPLLAFCARICGEEERKRLARDIARLRGKDPEQRGQICTGCIHALAEGSRSLLIGDLFTSLGIYTRMPLFRGRERFVELVAERGGFPSVAWAMESLLTRDADEITARFGAVFRTVTSAVQAYLDEMSRTFGGVPEDPSKGFDWAAERGRDHYYMQVTQDLIDKIGTGEYAAGAFLPTEAALSDAYGVCIATVRKALSMLNELGFGQTVPAKGTRVVLQDNKATMRVLKNKTFKRDTLRYLSGLQLMAVIIRPAAALACEGMDGETLRELERRLRSCGGIPLDILVQWVMGHQSLRPMKTILQATNRLLHWGYYFAFYSDGPSSAELLTQKSLDAFFCLRSGDRQGFADTLSACYCHILEFVRGFMVEYGLAEAAGIVTPDLI
ncbi:GntR family transcriptional regulator [Pseudoflavonifractor sp. BIOML-A6]|nr:MULTISPECIES: GntR family transcriptional regulator [unclassified Pseudoflavonifractor]MTQ95499.1 GntR family transcriptional regulator [Pseudoflavonifractor sp. BIOML-A16]MTR05379.1 GntR family transcriptional regulator [Pseudoflavonifractor sp. BIOML-A15]MTR31388.1 GntR family transcriptional regulator [Pseudoflavonifractor sp. BIOML-A14]MTR73257.1 GntR family transcriptional regulator [Pseudoflavonifractor sp. BIOML-A18]MTS63987.1 GntR family transcriptional regulator [Pseudoflavonifract